MFRILLKQPSMRGFRTLFSRRLAIAIPAALLVLLLLPLSAFAERPIPTSEVPFAGCQPGSIPGVHCLRQGNPETPERNLVEEVCEGGNLTTHLVFDVGVAPYVCSVGGAIIDVGGPSLPTTIPEQSGPPQIVPPQDVHFVGEGQRNPGPGKSTQPPSQSLPSDYSSPTCSGHCAAR